MGVAINAIAAAAIALVLALSPNPFAYQEISLWLAGSIGAALGDWVSYWFGYHFKGRIAHVWPLSRHPDLLPRGHDFMEKWGVLGIFIGRFFGPFRASVPLIAGILEMHYWHFQLANFSSAFLWAFVLLFFGDVSFSIFKMF